MYHEWQRDGYTISTDPAKLDLDVIHGFLAHDSYWAQYVPREVVQRSIANSIAFGLYCEKRQIGFARVITDRATFAYLADVFVIGEARGKGLGTWLVATILSHPELTGLRRWLLATGDAHGLYARFGFRTLTAPERWMEIRDPDVYTRAARGEHGA
jgi:GNAT superfamily N-acetyltransferase